MRDRWMMLVGEIFFFQFIISLLEFRARGKMKMCLSEFQLYNIEG